MKNRAQIEKELTTVLDGKEPYDKWFNRTRRNYGKHTIDMTKILYDSLEGLRSKEAQEMRAQYEQALQTVQSQYSAGAGVGLGGPQA